MAPDTQKQQRLDIHLTQNGAFSSRARAQEAIDAGLVRVNGAVAAKASLKVGAGDCVAVEGEVHPFVSRGGLKLEAGLAAFDVDPAGRICLDLGASTGGFCDVLLRRDAAKIYAVDVGAGQLHPKIAADPRVVNLERTHAKDLTRVRVREPLDLVVCDVSFISIKKALPPALDLAGDNARLVALVKPQFEVGRARIGKGGIVKEGRENHEGVVEEISAWLSSGPGWRVEGVIDSPIRGGDGNREFLIGATKEN